MTFQLSLLSSVYTEGMLVGSFMNSKAAPVVITSQENSLSKTFWWGMAKAGSCQWRNSTFGERLFRDTITKICCSKSEAQFKVLVNARYSFLSTERCLFTFLHAYSVNILSGGTCALFISEGIQSAVLSLWEIEFPNLPLACSHCVCCHLSFLWSLCRVHQEGIIYRAYF